MQGKLSSSESDTMGLARVGSDKGWETRWNIRRRNVLENQRIQQAFSQTSAASLFLLILVSSLKSCSWQANGENSKQFFSLLLLFAPHYRMVQTCTANMYICYIVFVLFVQFVQQHGHVTWSANTVTIRGIGLVISHLWKFKYSCGPFLCICLYIWCYLSPVVGL